MIVGHRACLGALLVAIFLVPVTFSMHAFWSASDPMGAMTNKRLRLRTNESRATAARA